MRVGGLLHSNRAWSESQTDCCWCKVLGGKAVLLGWKLQILSVAESVSQSSVPTSSQNTQNGDKLWSDGLTFSSPCFGSKGCHGLSCPICQASNGSEDDFNSFQFCCCTSDIFWVIQYVKGLEVKLDSINILPVLVKGQAAQAIALKGLCLVPHPSVNPTQH